MSELRQPAFLGLRTDKQANYFSKGVEEASDYSHVCSW
jgi:hypothetical protein